MSDGFSAERAICPSSGSVSWVVLDDGLDLHVEATAFLAALRARDMSVNTERVYAGRVALYLRFCAVNGLDWSVPGFTGLARLKDWLVTEPLATRSSRPGGEPRYRSRGSANAVLTAVCEFLRFGATHGWVPARTAALLSEPKFLAHMPPGYDPGEQGQFRVVQARTFRFAVADPGYETLTAAQIETMLRLSRRARDRFLVALLACTGMRIGEALGLRREDMHLLASSRALGCEVAGPHVHVRRRPDNANGALAKSRFPRSIPVTGELVSYYTDYLHERATVAVAQSSDLVFVNLFRQPLGRPMNYQNAKDTFDRLARAAGFTARPHMLRHSAATGWLRAGVGRDVAQNLLGHASPSSLHRYVHVDDTEKRDAVERVAAARRVDR